MKVIEMVKCVRIGNKLIRAIPAVQSPKNAPAATRTPTIVAPMPVTLGAPPVLLPPLKAPVDVGPEEEREDEPDPGVDVPVTIEEEDVRVERLRTG